MRISTQAASQSALMDLMRAQRQLYESGQQVSTGLKAPDLKGYGNEVETILFARGALARSDNFVEASKRLASRLDVQDLALNEMSDAVQDLRLALTTNDGTFLMNDVQAAFSRFSAALNTQFNGSFIFSGTRTDAVPFTADTIAQVQGAADIADLFHNSSKSQTGRIEENTTVETGFLADELAADLMAIFARIADFNAGPDGPFDGTVTTVQQEFLSTEIGNVIAAFENISSAIGKNGSLQARLETAQQSNAQRSDYLKTMIAGMEEVDMAEAANRLTQAQMAMQVSALVFSDMSQVSLLPFLR
ncbi:flagellin [Glycocaulis alkaliphilus]|uniref:Flagellin n=1 Tax=Glycocaulis alkaliphilus TaxID=1434191 RepID=A0A3T0EC85_9PROT|nr:flagellin [Glycocaulis alkaliphilus]AZU04906.1 flagellin [Glycocaulis alkaliphilus]GGB66744.1 flagellar hook-filament junction protein FlgL [Glycocaulis alkaliphilus]